MESQKLSRERPASTTSSYRLAQGTRTESIGGQPQQADDSVKSIHSVIESPAAGVGPQSTVSHGSASMSSFRIEEEQGRLASDLPPVDGGRAAWSYLIAATVLETLVWGEPNTSLPDI
jgi:hypothetical protein